MTTGKTLAPTLASALALSLALAACKGPPPKRETPTQQARAVSVVTVQPRAVAGSLAAAGDLVPLEEAAVLPEVTGYRVARVLVDEGAFVRKGQVLAELDPSLIQAQLAQQTALAAQAAVQADQAEAQARRVQGLDNEGVLSQEQIEQRRFQARAARATANAQAAALRDVRTRAAKLNVTAPVGGLVLQKTVRPGDLSAAGATPWFRIARDGQVELQAQMSQEDLARVRPGQHATVTLANGEVVDGTIRMISAAIDPQTKLGYARVRLPVRSDIRTGGFARAVFGDAADTALAVPEAAVRYDGNGASVMAVGADNRVHRVPITAGARGGGYVQLVRGPAAGTRIVANSASLLLDGDLVRPVEGPAPAAAPTRK